MLFNEGKKFKIEKISTVKFDILLSGNFVCVHAYSAGTDSTQCLRSQVGD